MHGILKINREHNSLKVTEFHDQGQITFQLCLPEGGTQTA